MTEALTPEAISAEAVSAPAAVCPKLTRRQAAIIGAFTGIACGQFVDIHVYVDSLPGFKGIWTISFAQEPVWEQIKRACREDFLAICSSAGDPK